MAADDGSRAYGKTVPAKATAQFPILLAAALSVSMAYGVTLPALPFLVERVHGADASAVAWHTGSLTGIYTFALFIFSPFWGALSDRIDRRAIIAAGLLGSAASLLLLDAATTLAALYVARGLSGALSAAVLPTVLAYAAETALAPDRPRKFAMVASASTLGFLLGPVIGSWLSPMVLAPLAEMRVAGIMMPDSPFFAVALASLLSGASLVFLPARADPLPPAQATAVDGKKPMHRRNRIAGLFLTGIAVFGITIAEVGITLLGKQTLSLTPQEIARFFMICSAVMIAVQIGAFPAALRKIGLPTLVATALLVTAAGLALIPYAGTIPGVVLAFAFVSAGTAILIPALATIVSEAAGPLQGKAMGQQASAANLGQAIAASLTGVLFLAASAAPFVVGATAAASALLIVRQLQIDR